jgi:hypothetical protein
MFFFCISPDLHRFLQIVWAKATKHMSECGVEGYVVIEVLRPDPVFELDPTGMVPCSPGMLRRGPHFVWALGADERGTVCGGLVDGTAELLCAVAESELDHTTATTIAVASRRPATSRRKRLLVYCMWTAPRGGSHR